jgi:hypothetical protein
MESTDSQLLPYPEPEDFANGSQQLKLLAEAIDAKLAVLNMGYDTILTRPTVLKSATPSSQTIFANISTTVSIPNVVYNSSSTATQASTTSINLPFYPAGIWMAGGYVATNPAGAVNQDTLRIVTLRVVDQRIQPGTGIVSYEEIWDHSGSQTNTGGDFTTFSQTFEIHDPENAFLQCKLFHGNTGSGLIVTGAFLWALYIGELAI